MLKRTTFALFLCLPLCAIGAGASLLNSASANEPSAEVTTWHGERALRIPVQLSAVDWSKAGFAATSTAETQTAFLYLTETAYQLQDGAGHTLMGGPRSDIQLEMSQCIRMRSLKVSVCANSPFPASKQAREALRGSSNDFSWLYYHLSQEGHNIGPAPNGTLLAANKGMLPGQNSSGISAPVLECRIVNPDGTANALSGPWAAPTPAPIVAGYVPKPAPSSAPAPVVASSTIKSLPTPAIPIVETAVQPVPAAPMAPPVDHAKSVRTMAAKSHAPLMNAAEKQPATMLETHSASVATVASPAMPIHVHHVAAPVIAAAAAPAPAPAANRAAATVTMTVAAAPRHAPANVPPQPKAVVAYAPKPAEPAPAAVSPNPADAANDSNSSDMASDDLTPAGAPRGVVAQGRAKTVSAKVADSHMALLQAEKAARAARVAEIELKNSQEINAIQGSAEKQSVPAEKPRSPYAARVTTSTVFSQPTHSEPGAPAIRNLAGTPASTASFAQVAAPTGPSARATSPSGEEMAEATETSPVHKPRHLVRPAFKPAGLPAVVDNDQQ